MSKALSLLMPVLVLNLISPIAAQNSAVYTTGISVKRPVFGGACRICPWGAMAQVVKDSMKFYGYDLQIYHHAKSRVDVEDHGRPDAGLFPSLQVSRSIRRFLGQRDDDIGV